MASATPTRTALDNALREKTIQNITDFFTTNGDEVLRVSGNAIAIPAVDEAGNDTWLEITIKVPKGERLGKGEGFAGYDGYEMAAFYHEQTEAKKIEAAAKKAAAAERKAKAEARKSKVKIDTVEEDTNDNSDDLPIIE